MNLTIEMFDNDERILLNGLAENTSVSKLSKKRCLAQLAFAHEACTDEVMQGVLDGLISKLEQLTDDDWALLRLNMPFEVWAADNDEPDELY